MFALKHSNIKRICYYCFILCTFLGTTMCEEKSDKQTKADACVKIIRSRIMQDREYFQELYKLFSKSEEAKDQGLQRLYSYSLFNCFDQIGYFDAEEIDSSKNVNALTDENKKLIDWEKWEKLERENNVELLEQELRLLSSTIEVFRSGEIDLSYLQNSVGPREQQYDNDNMNEYYNQNPNNDVNYGFNSREKKIDFSIFGFNFTKLDSFYKNIIGIGLIILVFLFVIIGLKWISNLRNKNTKAKKEKKERKEKRKQK